MSDDDWCPVHGDARHVHIHEAAHAVAAVDFGLEVGSLVLHDESTARTLFGGTVLAVAEVRALSKNPADFVLPDAASTLKFFLAGAEAELAVLGDGLPNSDDGDLAVWGMGVGVVGGESVEELEALSGVSLDEEMSATREWATSNASRIVALADHVGQHSAPWEMTFPDVKRFLANL